MHAAARCLQHGDCDLAVVAGVKANLVAATSTGNKNPNAARFAAQPAVMLLGGDSSKKVFDTEEHDTY